MRTLRQIPRVVGQTDAGETIYQARSARLVLRGDAAHFNRLVRCSKCGREVPGRAVLGSADLDQPAQAVVCNECVEAATQMSPRRGPLAEPVATEEGAVADAQAEMNMGPQGPVDEVGGLGDDEDEAPEVPDFEESVDGEIVDELDEVSPAEEDPPAVGLELSDDGAGRDEEELAELDEDEGLVAGEALEEVEPPPLADDLLAGPNDGEAAQDDEPVMFAAGLEEHEPPVPDDEGAPVADAGLREAEPPVPDDEAVVSDAGLYEPEPPAPEAEELVTAAAGWDVFEPDAAATGLDDDEPVVTVAGLAAHEPALSDDFRPDDEGLVLRMEALEERLAGIDPLRLVAIEETVYRLAERADAVQFAIQARLDELAAAVTAAPSKKEIDKLRRRLDQMGERLQELQATTDAEWARARSDTATLGQTIAELGDRVVRLAEQAGDTAGVEDERLAAVEEKVDEEAARLAKALEAQRQELEEGLREGLANVRAAVPAAAAVDDHDARFRALERQLEQSRGDVSELNELHAALDAGLGALRAEIGDVRTALSRVVDSKADLEDRLETFVRMSLVPEGDKGRKAKKSAESTLGTISAAVQDLLREQRQLKDSFATLEHASDAATAAAARASMQASSLAPLRSDVKLLHQELVEQQEAMDALRKTVEHLRPPPAAAPPPPAARPPAKKAAPAKKVAPAKKAVPVAKKAVPAAKAQAKKAATAAKAAPAKAAPNAKGAGARAAIAKAAAAQAAGAKAPAKRAPGAKKA